MMTFTMILAFILVFAQTLAVLSDMKKRDFMTAAEDTEHLITFTIILILVLFFRGC